MITKRITVPLLCLLPLLAVMALLGTLHTPTTNAAPDGVQIVTTLADDGAGSLRQAIADATAGDTVEFSVSGTIVLATELVIDKDLTINGGGVINDGAGGGICGGVVNSGCHGVGCYHVTVMILL